MSAEAVSPENLAKAKAILNSHPSIDLHSHLGLWESKGLSGVPARFGYIGDDKLRRNVEDMIAARCKCVSVNLTSDVPIFDYGKPGNKARDYQRNEAWEEYQRQMSLLREFFESMPLEPVTDLGDIERTFAKGKLAVLLSTEGGHMVEDDLGRLEQLFRDGIRKFQPIHYVHTKLGDSQTDPPAFGGLSPLGKRSVKEAVRLGMVVDAAHASFDRADGRGGGSVNRAVAHTDEIRFRAVRILFRESSSLDHKRTRQLGCRDGRGDWDLAHGRPAGRG